MKHFWMTICAIIAVAMASNEAAAQARNVGTSWSFSGIGITYEWDDSEDSFGHIDLKAEMADTFIGKASLPGASASFSWNLIFYNTESRNGVEIDLFAGPGFIIGITSDQMWRNTFFGLKGRAGVRLIYDRKINISLALVPVMGLHLKYIEEEMQMDYYKNGLLQIIMPEIGISYRF